MLEVRRVGSGYEGLQVLWDVDLTVAEGEWVALVGAAGAGKTTLMRTIAGSIEPAAGQVLFGGDDLAHVPAYERVKRGMSLVPEGRRLFRGMTVAENLTAGAFVARGRAAIAERLERVHALFPILAERRRQQVGTLSGGEQQMCAIGRALMSGPKLLLVDELSLGLAPVVVDELLDALVRIRGEGTTLLVVEQDVETSLAHADRGYVMRQGRIVSSGPSAELLDNPEFLREYLGVAR
jgi:branched-chain amino acid transport system ATP-binding protein